MSNGISAESRRRRAFTISSASFEEKSFDVLSEQKQLNQRETENADLKASLSKANQALEAERVESKKRLDEAHQRVARFVVVPISDNLFRSESWKPVSKRQKTRKTPSKRRIPRSKKHSSICVRN